MRHQLPCYSPLTLRGLAHAFFAAITEPDQQIEALAAHLNQRFESEHCLLLRSGTQALQIALSICAKHHPDRGGVVALPAYSCFDIATAALGAGVDPIFYDIDPVSLSPDLSDVKRVLALGPGALIAGNLHGYPVPWTSLRSVCEANGTVLIEDAAQGLGSRWKDRWGGSNGDLTVVSFGRGKGWTGGEGGALLVRRKDLGERLDAVWHSVMSSSQNRLTQNLSTGIRTLLQWSLGRPAVYGLPAAIPGLALGETTFKEPTELSPIVAFAAATILCHAAVAQREISKRQENAAAWRRILLSATNSTQSIRPCEPLEGGEASYLRFPVLARDAQTAETYASSMRRMGVVRGYPASLVALPQVRDRRPQTDRRFPGADILTSTLLTLPTHSHVRELDRQCIMAHLEDKRIPLSSDILHNGGADHAD